MHLVSTVDGAWRRSATTSTRSSRASRPAPCPARRRSARCRSCRSSNRRAATCTPARSATSTSPGNLDFCIAIRTITIRDGKARVQAGAGIVADSNPAAEYEETRDKARALLDGPGDGGGGAVDSGAACSTTTIRSRSTSRSTWASWAPRRSCAATTRSRSTRSAHCAGAHRDLAGPGPSRGCGHFGRADPPVRSDDPGPGRLPRTPGHRHRVRRPGRSRAAADARQDVVGPARRTRRVPGRVSSRSSPAVITRSSSPNRCPSRSRWRRGPRTARSWACGTARSRCTACSSTPSRC